MGLGDTGSIALGVAVGILSTSVQSLGLTLQRKSHLLEDEIPSGRPPHRRRRWQIGMLLFIIANILGSSVQITTLPLVILSPLQASGLVFNSICATLILSEPFTRYSLIGTILVSIGAALIAVFGALEEPAHSLDELLELFVRKIFILWMVLQLILVTAILIAAKASRILWPRHKNTLRMKMFRGISYGAVSGILSADCLLLAKSASELLVRTIVDGVNQFNRWQSWVILIGLVSLALTQLFYLHRGLKLCSTSVLYPFVFCVYNIIAILDGLLYYKQTSRLSSLHGGLIALGVLILLSGVLCLSWRLQDDTSAAAKSASALTPTFDYPPSPSTSGATSPRSSNELEPPSTPRRKGSGYVSTHLNSGYGATRGRLRALSQAEEIWGELQDDDGAVSPRTASRRAVIEEDDEDGDGADERTGLLRSNTGRSAHGGRRMRRQGTYGFPALSSRRSSRRQEQQGAEGGWWKMGWWRRESKERREGHDGESLV
ncbi:magnesium transporter NIPA-domain-containing protein [Pyronema omphalodes]|nr:magnesium transporter NIPA-domain-containing protein [Pyronema omphalodes]